MKSEIISVPGETKVLIAAPAQPMSKETSDALGNMLANFPTILEAHLPYCFIPNCMEVPSQILIMVLKSGTNVNAISGPIGGRLLDILPSDGKLLILPLYQDSPLVELIRRVGFLIFRRDTA